MPDDDIRARVYAVEILMAQIIADKARTVSDPEASAVAALQALQPAIESFPLDEPNLDAEATMRQSIAHAVADILRLAISRID